MIKEGKVVRLEYYDHSTGFEKAFPAQNCEIVKRYSSKDVDDWYLVKLSPLFFYHGIENTYLLIRSRWQDCKIGDKEPTSVFILLIANDSLLKEPLDIDKFYHVAWGMAYSV
jgi:hypothetical protein